MTARPSIETYHRQLAEEHPPLVVLSVSQRQLLDLDTSGAAQAFSAMTRSPDLARKHARAVHLVFEGFDADAREIPEIPECRRWLSQLHAEWPHMLHVLTTESAVLAFNTLCPGEVHRAPDGRIGLAPSSPDAMLSTVRSLVDGMAALHFNLDLDEEVGSAIADDFVTALGF